MIELPVNQPSGWIDEKRLLECIHCGLCLPACPTHVISGEEMPSPRGRLYLMRAVNEGRLPATDAAMHEHEWSCLVCRACETACPSGVQFGYLMEQTRAMLRASEKRPWLRDYIYRRVLPSRKRLNMLQRSVALVNALHLAGLVRRLGKLVGKTMPQLGAAMRLMPKNVPFPVSRPASYCQIGAKRGTVALLLGCVGDAFTSRINDATIRVLTRLGYEVKTLPNVTCCGALQLHAGYREEALALARTMMQEVVSSKVDFFLSNIAGCGAMLKDYGELFHGTEEEGLSAAFRTRVRDIAEFLAERHMLEIASLRVKRPMKVGYHAACHLYHAQKITDQPIALLAAIQNLEIVPLAENDLCCGSAGSYNIEHPHASDELLKRKMSAVAALAPEIVVTGNSGCLMQLEKGVRESDGGGAGGRARVRETRVLHTIELIDEIMRECRQCRTMSVPSPVNAPLFSL